MPFRYPRPSGDPAAEEISPRDDRRSVLPGQPIASTNNMKNGTPADGWRFDPAKQDSVVQMHPEVAGTFNMRYDRNSQNLDADPIRTDINYVSSEDIRRKSKGDVW